jgi:hypothetical protein
MKILPYRLTLTVITALLSWAVGCGGKETAEPSAEPATPPAAPGAEADNGEHSSPVAQIVFVGQKEACPCTRKRVDDTWKMLQGVLADGSKIPVEKIQLDVDEKRYDELDDLKSLMVAPGIYFFDREGKLIELLQGEVDDYKIAELIR